MAPTPLTLAETLGVRRDADLRALLASAADPMRRSMLAAKVEDMLNTVVRQIAFYTFERAPPRAARRRADRKRSAPPG